MSEPLRIAVVAEGPTDAIVIEAALVAILGNRPFILKQLQPEGSTVFGALGSGWSGVYRWCLQSSERGRGQLSGDSLLFANYDIVCLHLDADVAGFEYGDAELTPRGRDGALPCEAPCPPPEDSTNALRRVLLSWCGEVATPAKTVLCTPSKCTEAWVLAAAFPADGAVGPGLECLDDPEARLGVQPKGVRFRKSQKDYRDNSGKVTAAWRTKGFRSVVSEAVRFELEVSALA